MFSVFKKNKSQINDRTVSLVAGGTGGHIFPALVIAETLINDGYKIIFITDKRFYNYESYFHDITKNNNFNLFAIDVKRSKGFFSVFTSFFSCLKTIYICRNLFKIFSPKLVIGFGSYVSLPAIIAAFLRSIPSLIHEQNSYIGLGNRISAIFSKHVMTSFPVTHGFIRFTKRKAVFVGMPLRESIRSVYYKNTNANINYSAFFKVFHRLNILVLGGSQGAKIFSEVIPSAINLLNKDLKDKICIYHQARSQDVDSLAKIYKDMDIWYHVHSFFPDVANLMTTAHIIISRAGAGAISEISACGTPSILIPYKYAKNNHQKLNAQYLYKNGACLMLEEDSVSADKLAQILNITVSNNEELFELSSSVKNLAVVDAHEKIKSIIQSVLKIKKREEINKKISKNTNTKEIGIG